jgi:hypothetical protein
MRSIIIALLFAAAPLGWVAAQDTTPVGPPLPLPYSPTRTSPVSISGNTEICKGGETTLKVEGDFESFEWNDGSKDRYLRVNNEGTYEVTVKTKGGCTYTSSINVRHRPCM